MQLALYPMNKSKFQVLRAINVVQRLFGIKIIALIFQEVKFTLFSASNKRIRWWNEVWYSWQRDVGVLGINDRSSKVQWSRFNIVKFRS